MVNKKSNKSFFKSAAITILIVAMLVFSGPAQAVSVMISGLNARYTQGNSIKFQIEIDINDVDKYVQVSNVSLDLTGPIKKSSTFFLDGTKISGDGNITIEPFLTPRQADFGYGSGYGFDFGYGYGYGDLGYGYGYGYGRGFDFGYGSGYGYGYGGGGDKLIYIYNVTINTAYFPIGTYTVVASLNTGNDAKNSFDSAPATFEIIAPIQVSIKINPESINPKDQGKIKVTIFNNSGFDTGKINIPSVKFGPGKATAVDNDKTTPGKLMLSFNTNKTGIKCGDTQATLTGKTIDGLDIVGIGTFKTAGCEDSRGNNGGSSGSTGGGGGGGVASSEPTENIIKYEIRDCDLVSGKPIICRFSTPEHGISDLEVTGKESESVTFRVEALKGLSLLVSSPAPGTKYLNIWANSKRIREALVKFRLDNSWIASEGLTAEKVRMYRWDGIKWLELDTRIVSSDANGTKFEAKTTGFEHFAISGVKIPASTLTETPQSINPDVTGNPQGTEVSPLAAAPSNLATILIVVVALIAIVLVVYFRKQIFK